MAIDGEPVVEDVLAGSTDDTTDDGWSITDSLEALYREDGEDESGYDISLSTAAAMNDRPSLADSLDFTTYIDALYEFITHRETEPPLTISIDGEWGVGKSSFMLQLEYRLRKAGHFTVHFNPWLHQGTDALWGAFMLSVLQQLSGDLSLRDRLRGRLRLYSLGIRSDWTRALRPAAVASVSLVILASVILGAWVFGPEAAVAVLGFLGVDAEVTGVFALGASGVASLLGAVTWLTAVLKWSERNVVDPVQSELRSYLVSPRYEDHVSFIEHFHEDLALALDAYTGPHSRRIFVFVDDLDRCDVQQAAELMESINLLLSDDPRLVFLIGMDREKVSAGIAAKYERILDHLGGEYTEPGGDSSVDFGEEFIDKFVQVPFAIPRPNTFSKFGSPQTADVPTYRDIGQVRKLVAATRPATPRGPPPVLGSKEIEAVTLSRRDRRAILKRAERALGYNPRRVKKFVNLFRLYLLVADETDVLSTGIDTDPATDPADPLGGPVWDPDDPGRIVGKEPRARENEAGTRETKGNETQSRGSETHQKVTVEQLGKFVTIRLQWKRLVDELYEDEDLLATLSVIALRRRYWKDVHTELARTVDTGRATAGGTTTVDTRVPDADQWRRVNEELTAREADRLPDAVPTGNELDSLLHLLSDGLFTREQASGDGHADGSDPAHGLGELATVSGNTFGDEPEAQARVTNGHIARRLIDYFGEDTLLDHRITGEDGLAKQFDHVLNDRERFERAVELNADASMLRVDSRKLLRITEMDVKSHPTLPDQAMAIFSLGYEASENGDYWEASRLYSECLQYFRELGDTYHEAITLHNLGLSFENVELLPLALHYYEESDLVSRLADLPASLSTALIAQGRVHTKLEAYDEALERFEAAREAAESIADYDSVVSILGWLGDIHETRGAYDEALALYARAEEVATEYWLLEGAVRSLAWQGTVHEKRGAYDDALSCYETAHELAVENWLVEWAVRSLAWQGNVQEMRGAYDAALERYEAAYDFATAHGLYEWAVKSLVWQGSTDETREAYDAALERYEAAYDLAMEHDLYEAAVNHLSWQGDIYERLAKQGPVDETREAYDRALERYETAYEIASRNDLHELAANCLVWQATVYRTLEAHEEAIERYATAIDLAMEHGRYESAVNRLGWQGDIYESQEAYDEALERYETAYEIAMEHDLHELATRCLAWQATIHKKRNAYDRALETYERAYEVAVTNQLFETAVIHLRWQGDTKESLEAHDEALECYEAAYDLAVEHGLHETAATTRIWIGVLEERRDSLDAALEQYEASRDLARAHDLHEAVANALIAEGNFYRSHRKAHATALERYEAAYDLAMEHDLHEAVANGLVGQGNVHAELQEYGTARERFERALDIATEHDAQIPTANALFGLGDTSLELDEYETARSYFERAREGYEGFDDEANVAYSIGNLGIVANELGDHRRAQELLEDSRIRQEAFPPNLRYDTALAATLEYAGRSFFDAGSYDEAEERYERSRALFEAEDEHEGLADVHALVGELAERTDDPERAREAYTRSLREYWADLLEEPSLAPSEMTPECDASSIAVALEAGDYGDARRCFEALLGDTDERRFVTAHARVLSVLGALARTDGASERAKELYSTALERYERQGSRSDQAEVLGHLGGLAEATGDTDAARTYYERQRAIDHDLGRRSAEIRVLDRLIEIATRTDDEAAIESYERARGELRTPEP